MAATTAYTLLYIDGQTGIGKKWDLMYRLATLHQWPSSSAYREKQLSRKHEGPFPTLLPATAATPGWVVVTSAIAIRIL